MKQLKTVATHKIILSPYGRGRAMFAYDANGKRMFHGDSKEPLFAAARELLSRGLAHPEDIIETYWRYPGPWSMRARVGYAASRTVCERDKGGIAIQKYAPDY